MGSFRKGLKRAQPSYSESGSEEEEDEFEDEVAGEEEFSGSDDYSGEEDDDDQSNRDEDEHEEEDEDQDEDEESDDDDGAKVNNVGKFDEMEELEKEYKELRNQEQSLVQNLKRHKDEDLVKGQAIKNQKALWDKALELRICLQKAFCITNKLPQEPVRSLFCESDDGVSAVYSDLIDSSKKAIDSLVQLHEALTDNNPSVAEAREEGESQSSVKSSGEFDKEEEWAHISQMQSRLAPFRNTAIDKWQRKVDVHSGAAAKKAKLLAFNQNISDQVPTYMRDPSKMIRSMQTKREEIGVFGFVPPQVGDGKEEGNVEGDPELLDDSEFYRQLLKEFLEASDLTSHLMSSESAYDANKKKRKRKDVDRRASKSRKIRYNIHEKIVNFMAPQPMDLPPMAPKLFENLFGLKTQKATSAA